MKIAVFSATGDQGIAQVREAAQAFMQGWKAATN